MSLVIGPLEGPEDCDVDRGARVGYDFGLGSRSTMGGSGAAVGGATAVDIFTEGQAVFCLRGRQTADEKGGSTVMPKECLLFVKQYI